MSQYKYNKSLPTLTNIWMIDNFSALSFMYSSAGPVQWNCVEMNLLEQLCIFF